MYTFKFCHKFICSLENSDKVFVPVLFMDLRIPRIFLLLAVQGLLVCVKLHGIDLSPSRPRTNHRLFIFWPVGIVSYHCSLLKNDIPLWNTFPSTARSSVVLENLLPGVKDRSFNLCKFRGKAKILLYSKFECDDERTGEL